MELRKQVLVLENSNWELILHKISILLELLIVL